MSSNRSDFGVTPVVERIDRERPQGASGPRTDRSETACRLAEEGT
ncbi:hypothetical protein [Haloplanus aerogenes]|nr:hypothetical protein [Haloplanus aerogenes]